MFAWPEPEPTFTSRLAPLDRELFAPVETLKDGLKGRLRHSAAWKRLETAAVAPSVLVTVPATVIGSQLVGLNVKPSRFRLTSTRRTSVGMPVLPTNCGNGSETTVACAVCGSIRIEPLTTTFPRSNGPAIAGTTTASPNGPPLYDPVK